MNPAKAAPPHASTTLFGAEVEVNGDAEEVAFFSNPAAGGEEYALLPGKLFEAGAYPDKDFALSPSEIEMAVAAYNAAQRHGSPAAMNLEHKKSVLDGQLGHIAKVWQQGKDLFAQFAIPKWFHEKTQQQGIPLKVSAEWNKKTKQLVGAAWVLNPHIKDAEIIAAFSAAAQHHPCTGSKGGGDLFPGYTAPQKGHGSTYTMTTAQKKLNAFVTKENRAPTEEEIKAIFSDDIAAGIAKDATAFADEQVREKKILPCEKPGIMALFARLAEDDANTEEIVSFNVADPSDTEGATEGTRVDLLKAVFAQRPAHTLSEELLDPAQDGKTAGKAAEKAGGANAGGGGGHVKVVFSKVTTDSLQGGAGGGGGAEPDADRLAKLLSMTETGRAVLAAQAAAAGANGKGH